MFTHILDAYGYCPPNQPRNWAFWDDYDYWGSTGGLPDPNLPLPLTPTGGPTVNATNVAGYAAHMVRWLKLQGSLFEGFPL